MRELITAESNGGIRLWDIRSPGNNLGTLDHEDTEGILATGAKTRDAASARQPHEVRAHVGPANAYAFPTMVRS